MSKKRIEELEWAIELLKDAPDALRKEWEAELEELKRDQQEKLAAKKRGRAEAKATHYAEARQLASEYIALTDKRGIATLLNSKGFRTIDGKPYTIGSVTHLLKGEKQVA